MKWSTMAIAMVIAAGALVVYLLFQATGIFGGDSGDLVTAAYEFGVPHPPGYPLYTWLVWLATRMPLFTPAWRAGLMSSIPHALTLGFVYLIVRRLGSSASAGLFAVLMLGGNYPFFLYSTTPEVFALFDLFVVLIVYLLILWSETRNSRYLFLFSFIFGLSLTHHHVMLFLVPSIGWFIWSHVKSLKKVSLLCAIFFLLGLLPYLYIPIAARGGAIINWDRAVDVPGFLRLLTRQDYGSFVANGFYGALPIHRLLQLKAYGQFVLMDLSWVGVLFATAGFVQLWRQKRTAFWFLFLAILFIGPGFFFYASFPLMNRFSLGTYERFLLPSYTLLSILMGVGVSAIRKFSLKRSHLLRLAITAGVLLFSISMVSMTIWRFWGLRSDRTADALGKDIMAGLPAGSLLLVSRDTPLFVSQYVRYGLGWRPDIALIHANRLWSADYPMIIKQRFGDLIVPESAPGAFAKAFVGANRDRVPIYSNTTFAIDDGWFWVPYGLVYKLTKKDELPALAAYIDMNDRLWSTFQDPRSGILSRYHHLMLSDVLSVYADSRITIGKILLRGGKLLDAKRYFQQAILYKSDIEEQDGYTYLGLAELFDGQCDEALAAFVHARQASLVPDIALTLYESVAQRDACNNKEKARELMRMYEAARQKEEIPLGGQ
ncbi:MAG: DUF2723 domain-containing protein [Candidatus Gottesmanbacteria bacterium]|nr:DUF2723 domain-containing protein [Candidatus Gottesmanbacteria bacterium]